MYRGRGLDRSTCALPRRPCQPLPDGVPNCDSLGTLQRVVQSAWLSETF